MNSPDYQAAYDEMANEPVLEAIEAINHAQETIIDISTKKPTPRQKCFDNVLASLKAAKSQAWEAITGNQTLFMKRYAAYVKDSDGSVLTIVYNPNELAAYLKTTPKKAYFIMYRRVHSGCPDKLKNGKLVISMVDLTLQKQTF